VGDSARDALPDGSGGGVGDIARDAPGTGVIGTGGGPPTGVRLVRFIVEYFGATGGPFDGDAVPFGVRACPEA